MPPSGTGLPASHQARLAHADELLNTLTEQMSSWTSQNMPVEREYEEPETQTKAIVLELTTPVPDEFALIIGDAVHNLRSTLDHLAYELTVAHSGRPLSKALEERTEFPIFGPKHPSAGALDKKIGGVSADARQLIVGLQPSRRGAQYANDPLWWLHQLSIIDKHRRPTLYAMSLEQIGVTLDDKAGVVTWWEPGEAGHVDLRNPYVLGRYRTAKPDTKVPALYSMTYGVYFNEPSALPNAVANGISVVGALQQISLVVREVCRRLEPLLS